MTARTVISIVKSECAKLGSQKSIRKCLIDIRGYQCEKCKNTELPLDMHHIDGNNHNNNYENLKLLCKNCHGLTESYADKKSNT